MRRPIRDSQPVIALATWLEAAAHNVRLALRMMRKAPGLAATVIATIAISVGANSAVFSAIDAVLLRPLPFPDGDQLMLIRQVQPRSAETFAAPVRVRDWNRMSATFRAITGYYTEDASETSADLPERVKRAFVAPRFLRVLGVAPALGRDFTSEEEIAGGSNPALISHGFWQRRFGGDPGAVGKSLRLTGIPSSIVGVMPASFQFPDRDVDVWMPVPETAPVAQFRYATWFRVIGRLRPDRDLAQARADLAAVQRELGRQFPKTDAELTVDVQPLKEVTVAGVRRSMWILFGSVSLLLLIACTNLAALLLARATERAQEIALRFSLGASRRSVAGQLLTETSVMAIAGAGLGLFVASQAAGVFRRLAATTPRVDEMHLDWRLVMYTVACAAGVTIVCGIVPAIRGTRRDVAIALAHGGRARVSGHQRLRWALVGVQVALTVTLLAGAGLLLRSFQALGRVNPGFDADRVLTFHVSGSYAETGDYPGLIQRIERTLEFLKAVPGVENAATAAALPGTLFLPDVEMHIAEGRADTEPAIVATSRYVSADYFKTMKIPLLAGEPCRPSAGALVNRSFANAYFAGRSPIGLHLPQAFGMPTEIRGIVGDAREQGVQRTPGPTVYWCAPAPGPAPFFLVRTHAEPESLAATIRRKMQEIEPRRSVFDIAPLRQRLDDGFAENRLRTILLAFFALTALSLASVGLYGTLSYLVAARRREVGLRLALGAVRAQVVRLFLAQGVGVAGLATIAGLGLSLALTRVLTGMLYGVSPTDPTTLIAAVFTVLAVATIASLLPAIRAARLDPMQVLRDE